MGKTEELPPQQVLQSAQKPGSHLLLFRLFCERFLFDIHNHSLYAAFTSAKNYLKAAYFMVRDKIFRSYLINFCIAYNIIEC